MNKTWNWRAFLLAAAFVPGAALLAATPERLSSRRPSQPVTIDGLIDEWTTLVPVEEAKLAVGVLNDDRHLYIAISSSDQARRRQLLAAGLIIWLDSGGGKKRSFGVRFPGVLGLEPGAIGERPAGGRPPERAPSAGAPPPDRFTVPPLTYFELLGPKDDDRRRLERTAVTTIQVGRDMREGALVLELRVPLARDGESSLGLGTQPGQVIGLGLETPKIERPETPAGRGMGRRPGGMGGGMGGGGMGGGGMGGGMGAPRGGRDGERPERASPLKLWTTVQLATASS